MPFFAETTPNSVSYMKSMGVTNIFLRLSLITLVPEPSIKAAFWKSWNTATATSSSPTPPTAITKVSGTPGFTKGGLLNLPFYTSPENLQRCYSIKWNGIAVLYFYQSQSFNDSIYLSTSSIWTYFLRFSRQDWLLQFSDCDWIWTVSISGLSFSISSSMIILRLLPWKNWRAWMPGCCEPEWRV